MRWIITPVMAMGLIMGLLTAGNGQNPDKPAEQPKAPSTKKKAPPQEASDFENRPQLFFYQPPAIANLAWSPDGTLLATAGSTVERASEITVWNARIAKVAYILSDTAGVRCVRFSPDGKQTYVAAAGDNSVTVVNTATLKVITRRPVGQVPKRNGTALLRGLTPNK